MFFSCCTSLFKSINVAGLDCARQCVFIRKQSILYRIRPDLSRDFLKISFKVATFGFLRLAASASALGYGQYYHIPKVLSWFTVRYSAPFFRPCIGRSFARIIQVLFVYYDEVFVKVLTFWFPLDFWAVLW